MVRHAHASQAPHVGDVNEARHSLAEEEDTSFLICRLDRECILQDRLDLQTPVRVK